jgi:predicted O-linked N-acetylglucosamine transferase (SPINDLY family)
MEIGRLEEELAAIEAALGDGADTAVAAALARARSEGSGEALNQLGTALVKVDQRELAERAYRAATAADPGLYKPLSNLGNLLVERGEPKAALEYLGRAAKLAPDQARVWLNLGNAIIAAQADADEAVEAYERSVALSPSWKALHNLGAIFVNTGRAERAAEAFRRALEVDPNATGSRISLGECLVLLDRREEAEEELRRAASLLPNDPVVMANLVATLEKHYLDRVAIEVVEHALEASPWDETLLLLYVFVLERNGLLERAEARFVAGCREAVNPAPFLHLARLRARQRRFPEEVELLAQAEERFPDHPAVLAQKARKLRHEMKLDEAIDVLEELVARPDCSADMLEALAATFLDVGDAATGFDVLKRAEAAAPHKKLFNRTMMVFVANAVDGLKPEEISAIHRSFPSAREAALPKVPRKEGTRDRSRRLRIGYVSPDFRAHSVSLFFEPVLELHDRSQVEVVCYSITTQQLDETSERIRAMDLQFVDMRDSSDFSLAQRVAADAIDVLVDLTGWTSEQRMTAFQMEPAPVRVSYLGYPNTTGLSEVQYRISDPWADPPGAEAYYAETLFRLPRCAWAFAPREETPPVEPRPNGAPLTFGSFNNLQKTTARTIDLWAEVMRRVPGSRLLLKSKQLHHQRARARVLGELKKRGIDEARVELRMRTSSRYEHLAMYADVDIALDTFPYNGTTTTCEALNMGVPVVSLAGDTPASRVGRSLLRAAGLAELSAFDDAGYISAAVTLAEDRDRLRELRRGLRAQLAASELGDVAALTRALEAAYRSMWHAWLDGGGTEKPQIQVAEPSPSR